MLDTFKSCTFILILIVLYMYIEVINFKTFTEFINLYFYIFFIWCVAFHLLEPVTEEAHTSIITHQDGYGDDIT